MYDKELIELNSQFKEEGKVMVKYLAFSVLFVSLWASQAFSMECKGRMMKECRKDKSCTWVKSYKKKDGKKVSGFCRTATLKKSEKVKTKKKIK